MCTEEEFLVELLRKMAEDSDCKILAIIPCDGELDQSQSGISALEHPHDAAVRRKEEGHELRGKSTTSSRFGLVSAADE